MSPFKDFQPIIQENEPLAMHTWMQLGGNAEFFAEPESVEALASLFQTAQKAGLPTRILGGGSNILVLADVPGLVIHVGDNLPQNITVEGNRIRVCGNLPLSKLVTTAVRSGLGGIEELIGIPGTVGGALHGNAGTNSTDIGQLLKSARILKQDGTEETRQGEDLVFGYRQSSLDDGLILEAEFEFHEENSQELAHRMQKQWIIRKAMQPMGHQCAGRIFRNPADSGSAASEIIDLAGLKGTRIGGAVVCERHANFILTEPECTSSDVLRLIRLIQEEVFKRFGIELETEIEIWNADT